MKVCPHCHETYQHHVEFCFNDGEVLVFSSEAAFAGSVSPGMDAPAPPRRPPPAPSAHATPVPRHRDSAPRPAASRSQENGVAYGSAADAPLPPGVQLEEDENAPLPPSMIETAPLPRPVPTTRKQASSNAGAPLAQAETPVVDARQGQPVPRADQASRNAPRTPEGAAPRPAGSPDAPRPESRPEGMRPLTPPVGRQLVNTTPRVQTYESEVVEPESNGMLVVGIGALLVGAALLVGSVTLLAGFFIGNGAKGGGGRGTGPEPSELAAPTPKAPLPDPSPTLPTPDGGLLPMPVPEPVVLAPAPQAPSPEPLPEPGNPGPRPVQPVRPTPGEVPAPGPSVSVGSPTQRVRITSTPGGAPITVGGKSGRTPFELELPAGDYSWSVAGGGFKPGAGQFTLGPPDGKTREIDVAVTPDVNNCLIVYQGSKNLIEVTLNGKKLDVFANSYIPVGTQEFVLKFEGGDTSSVIQTIHSDSGCTVKLQ